MLMSRQKNTKIRVNAYFLNVDNIQVIRTMDKKSIYISRQIKTN